MNISTRLLSILLLCLALSPSAHAQSKSKKKKKAKTETVAKQKTTTETKDNKVATPTITTPVKQLSQEALDSIKAEEELKALIGDSTTVSAGLPWDETIRQSINAALNSRLFETTTVGIRVWDLTDGKELFSHNARQRLRPASTMKMITAVTALDRLGNRHTYKTIMKYDGSIDSTTLNGNIYIIGGMDPKFSDEDVRTFVRSIKAMGIDTIRGRLIGDRSFMTGEKYGSGWCWDDDNPVLTPLLCGKKDILLSRIQREAANQGIVIYGYNNEGKCPATAKEICRRERPITEILQRMMKNSDNLYAETMFYQISGCVDGKAATTKRSAQMVKGTISKTGLTTADYTIADGSGLSLYNYVTAEMEVEMLKYAFAHKDIYDALLPSLPIAGIDGTLAKRMKGTPAYNNVKAKTGTVEGVSALAGYVTASNGHILCFSIMNQGIRRAAEGRAFQDKICAILAK